MAKQTYAFETGGPQRLLMDWKYGYRDLTLYVDGALVGKIPGQKELQAGQEFILPDGSKLEIRLVRAFLSSDLSVERNGEPLPGSATDPYSQVRLSYQLILFLAIINLALGLVTELFQIPSLIGLGVGWYNIAFGIVFIGLGLWVRSLSLLGLWISIVLLAVDAVLSVVNLAAPAGGQPMYTGLLIRVLILVYVWRGIAGLKKLKAKQL